MSVIASVLDPLWSSLNISPWSIHIGVVVFCIHPRKSKGFNTPSKVVHVDFCLFPNSLIIPSALIDGFFRVPSWKRPCPSPVFINVVQKRTPQGVKRQHVGIANNDQERFCPRYSHWTKQEKRKLSLALNSKHMNTYHWIVVGLLQSQGYDEDHILHILCCFAR